MQATTMLTGLEMSGRLSSRWRQGKGKGNSGSFIGVATYWIRQFFSKLLGLLLLGTDSGNALVFGRNEVFGQLGIL